MSRNAAHPEGAAVKRRLLALPVDARPVVRQQVVDLVACAGWRLEVPAVANLGHLRQPADRDRLVRWLLAREARAVPTSSTSWSGAA